MQASGPSRSPLARWLAANRGWLLSFGGLALLPFGLALLSGLPLRSMFANDPGTTKFYQGLAIEIFLLAVYALSYDLLFGITGLLSLGHAMFFGAGAYLTGIMIKSFGWGLLPTTGLVVVAGVLMALLFGVVLRRVSGMTFALVTLGIAAVFNIVIQSRELVDLAGAEIGLQGVVPPDWISPVTQRLRFYYLTLGFLLLVYLIYKRFVDSPTGRVCIAIRENENRATMLGYNTFHFKLLALTISAITAAMAGALHALFNPLIRPGISGVEFTIAGLLMVLMGGAGTLSGAVVGAAAYRLLSFVFDRFVGEFSLVIIGVIYVVIVLYLPYGIVGTWRSRARQVAAGRQRLMSFLKGSRTRRSP